MSRRWTNRELDIVETLARRVSLLALGQLARGWWPAGVSGDRVRAKLDRLVAGGLLERSVINAHPLLELNGPLFAWGEGADEPDCETVSQIAKGRWTEAARPTEVYMASRLAANLFGSDAGRPAAVCHRDHDLLLAEVYVRYRRERPDEAGRWLGENALPKAGYRIKDPDAFLLDESGHPVRVIESAGRYDPRQVESFHEHCLDHGLPYELW